MARFDNLPGDNTGRVLTHAVIEPAYAATLSVTPNASKTWIKPATLTGAMTINIVDSLSQKYDELVIMLNADATNRVVTFGTNFKSAGTITVTASKTATLHFNYDGTDWLEAGRAITV
jgi:hypothetical protein